MNRFSVEGSFYGEEAAVFWNKGLVDGYPSLFVSDVLDRQRRLVEQGESLPGTPTGPFYGPETPEGFMLIAVGMLEPPVTVTDIEWLRLAADGDELGLWPLST